MKKKIFILVLLLVCTMQNVSGITSTFFNVSFNSGVGSTRVVYAQKYDDDNYLRVRGISADHPGSFFLYNNTTKMIASVTNVGEGGDKTQYYTAGLAKQGQMILISGQASGLTTNYYGRAYY